jgi:hypothetical protein
MGEHRVERKGIVTGVGDDLIELGTGQGGPLGGETGGTQVAAGAGGGGIDLDVALKEGDRLLQLAVRRGRGPRNKSAAHRASRSA